MKYLVKLFNNDKLICSLLGLGLGLPIVGFIISVLILQAEEQTALLVIKIFLSCSGIAAGLLAVYAIVFLIISLIPKWRNSFIEEQKALRTQKKLGEQSADNEKN